MPDVGPPSAVDPTLSRVEFAVAQLLRRAERRGPSARPAAAREPLDRSGYLLLSALAAHGPLTVNALAAALGLDGSTVTRQVEALQQTGRVERTKDPADRRAVVVVPTPTGTGDLRITRHRRSALYASVLAAWTDADRRTLADLLERLNTDLDAHRRRGDHLSAGRPPEQQPPEHRPPEHQPPEHQPPELQ